MQKEVFVIPLSFAQQRLWFLQRLEANNTAYNMAATVNLTGDLNVPALERSLNEVIQRHESLRTTFAEIDNKTVQVISQRLTLSLPVLDLSDIPESERVQEVQRLSAQHTSQPFDLATGPLLRATLLRLGSTEHVLLLAMHHIISDGWSIGVLIRELGSLYRSLPLPNLPIQYADFALWQRQKLQGKTLDDHLEYWRHQLGGDLPSLNLGACNSQQKSAVRQALTLPVSLSSALNAFSKGEKATLFMTLLAAFKVLLHRRTGEHDIIVGSPLAGRRRPETQQLIGFFINTLALRTQLSAEMSFREVVQSVRKVVLDAHDHEDLPFQKLVEELRPDRSLNRTPFFQVMFNLLNFENVRIDLPGLSVTIDDSAEVDAKFDLTLYAQEKNEAIRLELLCKAELFSSSDATEMLEQFELLLSQIVASPDQTIGSYTLVTPAAKGVLPDPAQPLASTVTESIIERFSRHARQAPASPAIVDKQEVWSYGELYERSNQLAHHLINSGIQPGDIVAIHANRSASLVWAMLGVLKAGAAFMILDAAYPPARLSDCLKVVQPKARLQLDAVTVPSDLPRTDPGVLGGPDDLAYVAFTSGSTGTPKAILGSHGPLVHFVRWHVDTFNLKEDDRFSLLSGLSHDPLLRDIFTPLSLGATICVPDAEEMLAPGALARWMKKREITVAHLTPAILRLLATDDAEVLTSLRYAFLGGDVLMQSDVSLLRKGAPSSCCVNFYGATETPQAMGYFIVPEQENSSHEKRVPLGRGISDVQLLVLDESQQLAGIGQVGEIYVRTPHLARGYMDHTLTAQKFITNPFTKNADDRLYKTGDRGRYLADGNVEFLGRTDYQVKIRGFRVELSEVEAVLTQHPNVQLAIVVASEDRNSLVAYYASDTDASLSADKLRTYLKQRLPEYLVPSKFVLMQQWPLTPQGKIDRRALPEPEQEGTNSESVGPRTPVEEILAGIWTEVLRADHISINDDFFARGGHSLLVAQMVSRVRQALHVELPLRSVFESPTIAALADVIESLRHTSTGLELPAIERVSREAGFPLSYAQQRLWFLDQLEPGNHFYNIAAAVRLEGHLKVDALEASLNEVLKRHEVLRSCFRTVAGEPVQVVLPIEQLTLPVIDLAGFEESDRMTEARRLANIEARQPFDLSSGPLLRAGLLRLAKEDHILLLTMHHVVSDGWSVGVLVREVTALYEAFSKAKPSPLPELTIQYADYAAWQQQWLQGPVLDEHLTFWRRQLADSPPLIALPTDRRRPAVQTYKGARYPFTLPAPLAESIKKLSRAHNVTLFMTLLAGFKALLYRYTNQDSIVVATSSAGRDRLETERLIGFFVNTIVLHTHLKGSHTFEELLSNVRDRVLEAFTHQSLPFEKLVEELRPERSLSYTPLFQVMFTLQNAVRDIPHPEGLSLSFIESETATAKFDLELTLMETAEGLTGFFEYNTDLFDAVTIERLATHFENLLAAVVERPVQRLSTLPLLAPTERHQMLHDWQDTDMAFGEESFQALFERQVERTPDDVAVVFEAREVTYCELNRRANVLAWQLSEHGAGPEVLVSLLARRSIDWLVAVLAIFKTGGAYLPLDPSNPARRLDQMLQQSRSSLVLASREFSELAQTLVDIPKVLFIEDLLKAETPETNPPHRSDPGNLAYVIFTSGSTGVPKGAMVEQRGMLNHLHAKISDLQLSSTDRVAETAAPHFDISVWQFLAALLVGGRVSILSDDVVRDPVALQTEIEKQGITVWEVVPSLLQAILEEMKSGKRPPEFASLRWMIVTGEALKPELCRQWLKLYPRIPMLNA
jgi:amino acid adenylation domain-containing protein